VACDLCRTSLSHFSVALGCAWQHEGDDREGRQAARAVDEYLMGRSGLLR
jgi:hypothetical protein